MGEQRHSREEDTEERRASVAESGGMSETNSGETRADRTEEAREEGARKDMESMSVYEGGLAV